MQRILNATVLLATVALSAIAQPPKTRGLSPLKTGIAHFDAERLDQARATLTPLAKAGDPEAMYYLGRIAIDKSDGDEAISWLEQAIKKNERKSIYHQWLGVAYGIKLSSGNPLTAMGLAPTLRREMERAVELDSANVDARINLVQFYLQAPAMMGGGVDKAREQVASITVRDPYQGRLQSAAIAENQKDTVVAERMLRDLVASFPDSTTPTTRLAGYYLNVKRYDDAFRVLDDRLRRAPNDGSALYQVGRAGALSGTRLDRAQSALERFEKIPHKRGTPSIAAAHWRMGMIFEVKGDKATAKAEYETALRLDPHLAGAKTALDRLK